METDETPSSQEENAKKAADKQKMIDDIIDDFSLYDYYLLTDNSKVLVSYKGPVTDVIMAEISRDIRNKFSENPKVGRRLFAIFMELAQNILYYSAEKVQFGERNDSVGVILITKDTKKEVEEEEQKRKLKYRFSCGNLVNTTYVDELIESCEMINSMNRDELREYKREKRSQPQGERSKGAGIGLIQVALNSENPLVVEFRKVDDKFSFFSLSVDIG